MAAGAENATKEGRKDRMAKMASLDPAILIFQAHRTEDWSK
jgi:hypothetical protein